MLKNYFITTRNYAVTYCYTLEEVPLHVGLVNNFQKILKKLKLCKNKTPIIKPLRTLLDI